MKNIVSVVLIATLVVFSSCKEENKKEINSEVNEVSKDVKEGMKDVGEDLEKGLKDAKESVKSAFKDITIPNLNNEKAENHLKEYAEYIDSQTKKGVENIKNSEFIEKTKEFATKSESFMENLGKEAKLAFKSTLNKIDKKASEIESDLKK